MLRIVVAVALMSAALSASAAPCAGFTDVEDSDPFCPNVTWIKNRNITLGCAVGLYCPTSDVSRLSMAAFLNRLGDVLLPPNVIWVAPEGGQFQSIQAAIDYAANLPGTSRRLVKVAPGTYNEAIVMASNVDVEGSGPGATTIVASICSPGLPTTGTVKGASNAQIRDLTITVGGTNPVGQCAAVYLDAVNGTALRNVRIDMLGVGLGPAYGIIIVSTGALGWLLTLDQVYVTPFDLGGQRVGILIDSLGYTTRLRDVTVSGLAENSPLVALRVVSGNAILDGTQLIVAPGVPPSLPLAVALQLAAGTTATVERSALRATNAYAEVAGGATLRIANSMLEGVLTGTATCIGNYDPSFAPVAC